MNLSKVSHITRTLSILATVVAGLMLTACDSLIYDEQGDCNPYYKVRFKFDWNLHFADAFPNEVNAVALYVVDAASGDIVWSRSESGEALKEDGYMMNLDGLKPGNYNLIAWCGEGVGPHFAVPEATHHTGLTCTMMRSHEQNHDGGVVRDPINRLYYGHLDDCDFPDEEGVHTYVVPLIKNTNEVNIVLQHLSGEPIDKDDYMFTVTAANGSMNWDNQLLEDENITYYAHTKVSGVAGVSWPATPGESRAITSVSTCTASHTVSRLTTEQSDDVMVSVYNKQGEMILSVPLIHYALLVKGSHQVMDDQEYLDRQDKYDLVFFLDEGDRWMNAYIYINSWKLVLQDIKL